jgi:hypothetical protein
MQAAEQLQRRTKAGTGLGSVLWHAWLSSAMAQLLQKNFLEQLWRRISSSIVGAVLPSQN